MTVGGDQPRLRVGVLTPHTAVGPEIEIPDLSQGHVTVTVARIRPLGDVNDRGASGPTSVQALRALAEPEALDRAAEGLASIGRAIDVVVHASTTTGYALGARSEAVLLDRLAATCSVPVVASASAAVDALRACEVSRLVLVHPPWFSDDVDRLGISYFRDQGFDVTLRRASGLSRDPSRVRTEDTIDWVGRHVGEGEEALFLAGNGFRAARAVAALEHRTHRLVLQANQVLLWSVLGAAKRPLTITGCGRLFGTPPTPLT